MNKTRKLLIGLGIIVCFIFWYKCCAGSCDLFIGADKCGILPCQKSFRQEDWAYRGDSYSEEVESLCKRESMICDLTQNVIPIGTPYEKVVALLGEGSIQCPHGLRYQDLDAYHKLSSKPLCEKKLLEYTCGGNVSGANSLVIVFENDRVEMFLRAESR